MHKIAFFCLRTSRSVPLLLAKFACACPRDVLELDARGEAPSPRIDISAHVSYPSSRSSRNVGKDLDGWVGPRGRIVRSSDRSTLDPELSAGFTSPDRGDGGRWRTRSARAQRRGVLATSEGACGRRERLNWRKARETDAWSQVVGSSETAQRTFLAGKGLAEDEVDEAFRLAKEESPKMGQDLGMQMARVEQPTRTDVVEKGGWRWTQVVLYTGFAVGGLYAANAAFGEYLSRFVHKMKQKGETPGAVMQGRRTLDEILQVKTMVQNAMQESKDVRTHMELQEKALVSQLQGLQVTLEKIHAALEAPTREREASPASLQRLEDRLADIQDRFLSVESQSVERNLNLDCELTEIKSLLQARSNPPDRMDDTRRAKDVSPEEAPGAEPAEGTSSQPVLKSHALDLDTSGESPEVTEQSDVAATGTAQDPEVRSVSRPVTEPSGTQRSPVSISSDRPPHPQSYLDVLAMLERGETPPGIRSDVADQPPDPAQVPRGSTMHVRPKPWLRPSDPGSDAPVPSSTSPAEDEDDWRPPSPPQPSLTAYTI